MTKFCFLKKIIILGALVSTANHTYSMEEIKKNIESIILFSSKTQALITEVEIQKQASSNQSLVTTCTHFLKLNFPVFNKKVADDLPYFSNLTELTLAAPPNTKHPGFSNLLHLKNLAYLDISGHQLAKVRFSEIIKITTLETLIMNKCNITNKNLFLKFKKLNRLKVLEVKEIDDIASKIQDLKNSIKGLVVIQ